LKKKNLGYIAIVVIAIILAASVFYLLTAKRTGHEFEYYSGGVLFTSDAKQPMELLEELSGKNTFFISPALSSAPSNENSSISNSFFLPAMIVVAGNDKNAVSLARVFSGSELKSCETNLGDARTRLTLSAQECLSLIESSNDSVFIFADFPNAEEVEQVFVSENSIEVKTNSFSSMKTSSLALLERMFPNARGVIESSNQVLGGLGFG